MSVIQFSHANGFSASTYQTFLEYFRPEYEVSAVEQYGPISLERENGWNSMVEQLIQDIETKSHGPVIAVGHSLGGILTFFAAQRRPELFSQMIIMDPPMFSRFKRRAIRISQWLGVANKTIPPAKKALRRRRYFESREEAYEYFKEKRLFRNFDPRCFKDYINHGIIQSGENYTLAVSADLEYKIFLTLPTHFEWKLEVPSHFIYTSKHEVLDQNDIKELKRNLKHTQFIPVEYGGHMFPLEQPEKTAEIIMKVIGK